MEDADSHPLQTIVTVSVCLSVCHSVCPSVCLSVTMYLLCMYRASSRKSPKEGENRFSIFFFFLGGGGDAFSNEPEVSSSFSA